MMRAGVGFSVMLLLVAALLPASAAGASIDQRIAAQRAREERLQLRLHSKRVELHAVTVRYQDLQGQLDETNAAIDQVNGRLATLADQQTGTQRRIDWNTMELDAAKRSLHLHDELLKRRLVNIYEYGDLNYFDAIVAARSFSEFVERWEDLRLLIAANQRAVRARKAAEERVAEVEAALEATRMQLQAQQQEQDEARSQLESLAGERHNLVELAGDAPAQVAAASRRNGRPFGSRGGAARGASSKSGERELAAQQRAAGIAGGNESAGGPGTFSWPVTGTITSPFGWRSNPFGGSPGVPSRASTSRRPRVPRSRPLPAEPLSWLNGTAATATTF